MEVIQILSHLEVPGASAKLNQEVDEEKHIGPQPIQPIDVLAQPSTSGTANLQGTGKLRVVDVNIDTDDDDSNDDVACQKLASYKIKEKLNKGRPPGKVLTAIGLRQRQAGSKIQLFNNMTEKTRCTKVLSWLVPASRVKNIIDNTEQISLQDLAETTYATLYDGLVNLKPVQLKKIKKFFTENAFLKLENLIGDKRKFDSFTCGACKLGLGHANEIHIMCETCLLWFHLSMDCASCTKAPKASYICQNCCINL